MPRLMTHRPDRKLPPFPQARKHIKMTPHLPQLHLKKINMRPQIIHIINIPRIKNIHSINNALPPGIKTIKKPAPLLLHNLLKNLLSHQSAPVKRPRFTHHHRPHNLILIIQLPRRHTKKIIPHRTGITIFPVIPPIHKINHIIHTARKPHIRKLNNHSKPSNFPLTELPPRQKPLIIPISPQSSSRPETIRKRNNRIIPPGKPGYLNRLMLPQTLPQTLRRFFRNRNFRRNKITIQNLSITKNALIIIINSSKPLISLIIRIKLITKNIKLYSLPALLNKPDLFISHLNSHVKFLLLHKK